VPDRSCYIPAIIRSEHDSALDALLALDLPRDEAMDLLVAGWSAPGCAILATVDGGRPVVAVPQAGGRWAACNAYPEHVCHSPEEAGRRLRKLLKRGRHGLVARIAPH